MTEREFYELVYNMRRLQKQYFKSKPRDMDILRESKAAETAVDRAVQDFIEYKQTSLF